MQHNQQEHTVSKKKNGSESRETESADIHKEREHPSVPNPAYFYEKEGQAFRAERSRTSRRSQPLRHRSTSAYGQRSARSAASPAAQKKGSSVLENTEPLNHPASHKRTTKKKRRSLKILNIAFLLVILLAGFLTFDNALLRHSNKELLTRLEAMESPPDLTVDAQTQKYGYAGKPISDLYPDMVVDWYMEPAYIPQEPMVYLTFDDGPSKMTPQILDILDAYGVKATFFVTGTKDETLSTYYKQIVDRGHTLAMHTWSHQYNTIYASVDHFLTDYYTLYTWLYEKTGEKPTLYRFPGGTTNAYANKKFQTFDSIKKEMNSRGFTYFDWNVSSGDAAGQNVPADEIIENVVKGASGKNYAVVLMHDSATKGTTVAALPRMIERLADAGFHFDRLTSENIPIQFK